MVVGDRVLSNPLLFAQQLPSSHCSWAVATSFRMLDPMLGNSTPAWQPFPFLSFKNLNNQDVCRFNMINITDNPTTLKQGHLTFCMIPSNCYMDGQSYVYLSAHTIYTLLLYIPTFYHKHFSRCGTVFMVTFREHIGFHQWSLHPLSTRRLGLSTSSLAQYS